MTTTVNLSTVTEAVTVDLSTTTQMVTLTVEQNNPGSAGSVSSVNGQTGAVVLDADDIDDTATGNKFTTQSEKDKLAGIEAGAEVNVNADWEAVSGDAQILNKPTLGTAAFLDVGTSASNVVQLDGGARLPAVDGSQLTNLPSGGATNLSYTASPTDGTVTSDTGTNATLTLADGTNAGLMAPADFTKLSGIEANADVTDTTNVTAAGAVMDSEVSSLSGIKTLTVPDNTTISAFGATLTDDADASAARTTLGLGTASTLNVGTSPNNVVQLDGSGLLPAVDGSQLTNLPNGFSDPMTTRGDLIYRDATNTTNRLPIGTNGQVLTSDGTDVSWATPSSGATNLGYTASPTNGTVTSDTGTDATLTLADATNAGLLTPADFTKLGYLTATGAVNLDNLGTAAFLDVGTSASQVVQLDGSARLPAVDGSQLTNLPGGGLSVAIHSSSTLSPTVNTIYLLDTTSNAITVTLPDSPASGSRLRFCDKAAKFATNNVTINRSGTNTIADGAITQLVLNRDYSYVELTYDNGNWSITGGNDFVDYLNSAITDEIQTVTYNDGGNSTLNNGSYNAFSLTANGTSTTIAHSGVPASGRYVFELYLNWTAGTITWPTSWTLGDNAPTDTGQYLITGVTYDGGTNFMIGVQYL